MAISARATKSVKRFHSDKNPKTYENLTHPIVVLILFAHLDCLRIFEGTRERLSKRSELVGKDDLSEEINLVSTTISK
jgi:hypothetical protein